MIQKDPDHFFPTFHPQIDPNSKNFVKERTIKEFLEFSDNWNNIKHEKAKLMQMEKQHKMEHTCTFKPKINDKSIDYLSQSQRFGMTEDFLDRVEKYKDIKEQRIKILDTVAYKDHSFKPQIHSKD